MATDALGMFAEAMMLARRRSDLAPLIERTVARLHEEGARAYADVMQARGWRSQAPPEVTARKFWTLAVGVTLEGLAMGRTQAALVDEMMRLTGQQAEEAQTREMPKKKRRPRRNERPSDERATNPRPRSDESGRTRGSPHAINMEGCRARRPRLGADPRRDRVVAVWPNPLTFLLAVAIIGSRQLGISILMHDGAHGSLAKSEKLNLWLSQWFCAYPVFAETRAYRRYHLQHHARTQQEDDPDLVLSKPFPITAPSYRRKFFRDITGQTGYAQRKAQFLNALGDPSWPRPQRAKFFAEKLGPQILVNAALFAGMSLAGVWWAYPLLWLLPLRPG